MGFESIVYRYVPGRGDISQLVDALSQCGATPVEHPASSFRSFVTRSPTHWIDLQLVEAGEPSHCYLSVRVALCNPPEAIGVLRQLFQCLLSACGGSILEPVSKTTLTAVTDDTWHVINQGFEQRRQQFVLAFGPFAAPISGEQVMEYIRQQRSGDSG
jgi:hypothetical protein